jgi:hypothetical protein
MQSTQPPDESDSGLDRLLGEARWPEPTSEQLARLRDGWTSLRAKRRKRRYLLPLMSAVAASVLLAVGMIALLRSPNAPSAPAGPNNHIAAQESAEDEKTAPGSLALKQDSNPQAEKERVADSDSPRRAQSQEPSLYERVALIGLKQSSPKKSSPKKSPPKHIASSVRKPRRSLATASPVSPHMRELSTMIPSSLDDAARQFATFARYVARWRQQIVTSFQQQAVRFVVRAAAARETGRGREIRGLSPHASFVELVVNQGRPADIANLITQEPDAVLRCRLLAALAARGNAEAVEVYLYFVMRPESSVEALDAIADVVEPPDALFLAYFRSPQISLRRAAALALSRSRNPIVIDLMAAAIDDASLRRQALVALLLSRDPRAADIVNEARGNLYLVASVRAAEIELHQLAQTP